MPTYPRADDLYAVLRPCFDRIQAEAPEALRGLLAAHLLIRLRCSAPAAEIWLNGKQKVFQASYGPGAQRPDLDVELAADTLHQLLANTLSTKKAMGSGLIRVKGPVWKLSVLIDIIRAGRRYYPVGTQRGQQ